MLPYEAGQQRENTSFNAPAAQPHTTTMGEEAKKAAEDPGRADYQPTGDQAKVVALRRQILKRLVDKVASQYHQGFRVGAKVWVKIGKDAPEIQAWVKEANYDEDKDGWVYKVQEKDKEGNWYGKERLKRASALNRA